MPHSDTIRKYFKKAVETTDQTLVEPITPTPPGDDDSEIVSLANHLRHDKPTREVSKETVEVKAGVGESIPFTETKQEPTEAKNAATFEEEPSDGDSNFILDALIEYISNGEDVLDGFLSFWEAMKLLCFPMLYDLAVFTAEERTLLIQIYPEWKSKKSVDIKYIKLVTAMDAVAKAKEEIEYTDSQRKSLKKLLAPFFSKIKKDSLLGRVYESGWFGWLQFLSIEIMVVVNLTLIKKEKL